MLSHIKSSERVIAQAARMSVNTALVTNCSQCLYQTVRDVHFVGRQSHANAKLFRYFESHVEVTRGETGYQSHFMLIRFRHTATTARPQHRIGRCRCGFAQLVFAGQRTNPAKLRR